MSNYDYNKISNNQNDETPKEMFSGLSQIAEDIVEPETESVLTTTVNVEEAISEPEETHEEIEEQPVEEPTEVPANEVTKVGVVDGCDKLNIRKSPDSNSEIACPPLNKNAKVIIDEANSTADYYKIYLSTGLEGYCLKEYIKATS